MKTIALAFFILSSFCATAQKTDSIFIHLYTDSLKKGTYNYINVDGLLQNGRYQPLDSSDVIFQASDGKFYGNSLFIDKDFRKEKVLIKVTLRHNPKVNKEFTMFIKTKADDEHLKTTDEIMNDMNNNSRSKPTRKNKSDFKS